ncbi:19.5g5 protein [Bracoviriform inaniti]|uniref:19.5g5 protein n=1 Tax=Bracoviriform inaniti TaxID=36344 RepID=A8E100_9VIRU|nr:19.5g5 protein [Bracoviriform inaniti]CAO98970.1 19.5g5 protein [Bracoviriform inaniti]
MVFSLTTVSGRPLRRAGCISTGLLQFPCATQCECDTVRVGGREGCTPKMYSVERVSAST